MNHLKKIAIIDMDGTLFKGQMQQGLINFLFLKRELNIYNFIFLNLFFLLYKIGLSNIESIFYHGLIAIKNRNQNNVELLINEFVKEYIPKRICSKSIQLIDSLKKEGYFILILSSAIDILVSKISLFLKADDYISTRLELNNGIYTGHVLGKVVYGGEKINELEKYFLHNFYSYDNAVAYSDHKSDFQLLHKVKKGYIANPGWYRKYMAKKEGIDIIDLN